MSLDNILSINIKITKIMLTSFFMGLLRVLTVTAATYTGKQLLELVNESDNNAEKNTQ